MTDRRTLVRSLAALALLPGGCVEVATMRRGWASASGADEGDYGLVVGSPEGLVAEVPSGFRGHGTACDPAVPGRVVMFARRPGTLGLVVDLVEGRSVGALEAAPGLRMQGHGAFSADGSWLYATLADEVTAEGVIGVWRTDTWELVDRMDSHGLGPHEILLMPDGRHLVVANGGLLTRPETGAEVLNLDTMDSSLVRLDAGSGELVEQVRMPVDKASLRHLAVAEDGTVAVGAQVQREAVGHLDPLPLLAAYRAGRGLEVFDTPELIVAMADYVGSVAVSSRSRVAATSSPRGDLVLFWDLDGGDLLGHHALTDVSGLAVDEEWGRFILSSSSGQVRAVDVHTLLEDPGARQDHSGVRWDNHLTLVTL